MKKKLFTAILACLMVIQCSGIAFAVESKATIEVEIENAICQAKAELRESMYRQLESQGALAHMSYYEELLYPRLEIQIREQYGQLDTTRAANIVSKRAPNGGMITYVLNKAVPVYCTETFLNRPDTEKYLAGVDSERLVKDVIAEILGRVPGIGNAFSFVYNLICFAEDQARDDIVSAGTVADILYMKQGDIDSHLITGWGRFPDMCLWQDNVGSYTFYVWEAH